MNRIKINPDEMTEIYNTLDDNNIPWDLDSGNRIMIEDAYFDEATDLLNDEGFDFDII